MQDIKNYLAWTKSTLPENWFFWSNPYEIEVMITSLIGMLDLPNFGHMTTSTIQFESRIKILLVTLWTKHSTSWPLFQNAFILREPRVASFALSKLKPRLSKKPLKTQKKLKELEIMY